MDPVRGARRGRRRDSSASAAILRQAITRLAAGEGTVSLAELRRHLLRAESNLARARSRGWPFTVVELSPHVARLGEWLRGERKAG